MSSTAGDWQVGPLYRRHALPVAAIEAESLRRLKAQLADRTVLDLPAPAQTVALRMGYAVGDPEVVPRIVVQPKAVAAGMAALARGADVIVDVRMVEAGVRRDLCERLGVSVWTAVSAAEAIDRRPAELPRSALGMLVLRQRIPGSVVVIGNAPTALLTLLDLLDEGLAPPRCVIATPPGFVAAVESKQELLSRTLPAITLPGTRGGSAMAVAAVNTLLTLASGEAADAG